MRYDVLSVIFVQVVSCLVIVTAGVRVAWPVVGRGLGACLVIVTASVAPFVDGRDLVFWSFGERVQ